MNVFDTCYNIKSKLILNDDYCIYVIVKRREIKKTQISPDEDTEALALNAEAETFIKHLTHIAEERNLEKIMEDIVQMDLDHSCMFQFLVAIEMHVSTIKF